MRNMGTHLSVVGRLGMDLPSNTFAPDHSERCPLLRFIVLL